MQSHPTEHQVAQMIVQFAQGEEFSLDLMTCEQLTPTYQKKHLNGTHPLCKLEVERMFYGNVQMVTNGLQELAQELFKEADARKAQIRRKTCCQL
jgi:hypothetical protein